MQKDCSRLVSMICRHVHAGPTPILQRCIIAEFNMVTRHVQKSVFPPSQYQKATLSRLHLYATRTAYPGAYSKIHQHRLCRGLSGLQGRPKLHITMNAPISAHRKDAPPASTLLTSAYGFKDMAALFHIWCQMMNSSADLPTRALCSRIQQSLAM